MLKIFHNIIISFLILISSILFAVPTDKNNIPNETILMGSIPTESRVIVGDGAKVLVGTKLSAKLSYDKLVLLKDARLIENDERMLDVNTTETDAAKELSEVSAAALPTELSISRAYPNPFNPVVNISYGLPEASSVKIMIHDLSGRMIAEYHMNQQAAGWHDYNWNAVDQRGQAVGSGIYLLTIQASDMVNKQKITFLK